MGPLLALGVALGRLAMDRETGLLTLWQLSGRLRDAELRVVGLERERRELSGQVRALDSEELGIERLARSRLGMVRAGELVVRLEPDAPAPD